VFGLLGPSPTELRGRKRRIVGRRGPSRSSRRGASFSRPKAVSVEDGIELAVVDVAQPDPEDASPLSAIGLSWFLSLWPLHGLRSRVRDF
jgi:hypothetical protein